MGILIGIVIISAVLLILALIKIISLQKGYDDLTENINDQITGETGTPITLSTADLHARKCADTLNTELKKLREERIRHEQGNRKIKEAVTGISHDLRTPLTAITSYLELIENEPDEAQKQEYLKRIKNRTEVLSSLTEELFSYTTSSEKKNADLNTESKEKIDLRRALEECLISFYAAFTSKGIEPLIQMPDEAVIVKCDKRSANRIIENLIGNALKYSEGNVRVCLTEEAVITFENPAPSLTPVTVSKLFDRYYTVKDAKESTGLGFSIAKELIEQNGGTIEAVLDNDILRIILKFAH